MKENKIILLFLLITLLTSCNLKKENDKKNNVNLHILGSDTLRIPKETKDLNGEQLSMIYCQQCHTFPDPQLLEKEIWKSGVLPRMGLRLGIEEGAANPMSGMSFDEMEIIYSSNIYPDKPLISKENWQKIVEYYTTNSPDSIKHEERKNITKGLNGFTLIAPEFNRQEPFNVSLLKYDTTTSNFFVGDSGNKLNILNSKGEYINTLETKSPAVDLEVLDEENFIILNIGNLSPSDMPAGLLNGVLNGGKYGSMSRVLLKWLKRPVDFSRGDLDGDTLKDIVVSNFGYYTGSLSWYKNKGIDTYEEHVLRSKPGAQKSIIKDMNGDGLSDIVALISQGDEGIFIYYNQGNGKFKEESLIRFSPLNGSNYFDLMDFNNDGFLDILYVNGDNADYSFSLKEYHGITLYLNDGKNGFQKEWFYPLYGASKAVAEDFDKDGDLDIAAIAFFPDFNNPVPFVYLENKGNFSFSASTLKDPTLGRWLTMETGDFDKDGDMDIALGKYVSSPSPVPEKLLTKWAESAPYVVILDNNLKK